MEMDFSDNDNNGHEESVQEKRMKWMLNADKALAEQLQSNEFRERYKHNKQKNSQLREDISSAKSLAKELEKRTTLQIETDREIAKKLAEQLAEMKNVEFLRQAKRDEELAEKVQELESDLILAMQLQNEELRGVKKDS